MSAAKIVLIVGATSGIGRALAELFAKSDQSAVSHVYVTGRRKEVLDELSKQFDNVTGVVFDPNDLDSIAPLVKEMVGKGVNYVILNAGMQRGINFTKADTVNLKDLTGEMHLNYFAPVYFIKEFLAAYNSSSSTIKHATIASVTSGLALAPLPRCPGYCASKAALRSFILSTRRQIESLGNSNHVKLVEILPPMVDTELHDAKHQPDLAGVTLKGVPLDEYSNDLYTRIMKGDEDEIPFGTSSMGLDKIGKAQRAQCDRMPLSF